jgi:hypothetical protein
MCHPAAQPINKICQHFNQARAAPCDKPNFISARQSTGTLPVTRSGFFPVRRCTVASFACHYLKLINLSEAYPQALMPDRSGNNGAATNMQKALII